MQILPEASLTNEIKFHFIAIRNNAIRIVYDKDRSAYTKPLFKNTKALTAYETNLFQILSLISKCKNVKTEPRYLLIII